MRRQKRRAVPNRQLSAALAAAPQMAGTALGPFSTRILTPFAPRFRTSMEFYQTGTLTSPASDATMGTEHSYRLNSLFAPDVSSTQKPIGFSTLALVYARWRVDRVRIQIRFLRAVADSWVCAAIVGPSQTYTTTGENPNDLGRNPMVSLSPIDITTAGNNYTRVQIEKEFSIAQLFGYTQAQYEAQLENVTGTDTTSPAAAHIPYLLVNSGNRGTSSAVTTSYEVRLIFDCTWFERDVLIQ
jgi:hypothetical protein